MTTIRRKRPDMAESDSRMAPDAQGYLATAPLRVRRPARRSLLWTVAAAAALAALLVLVSGPADRREVAKPALTEGLSNEGPATTGSFSRAPSRGLPAPAAPAPETTASLAPPPSPAERSRVAALPPAEPGALEPAPAPLDARRPPSLNLSSEEIEVLLARGEGRLKVGDLATARLYFERLALAGDRRGALGMARTYDPAILAGLPVLGPQGDPAAAKRWYERAASQRAGG